MSLIQTRKILDIEQFMKNIFYNIDGAANLGLSLFHSVNSLHALNRAPIVFRLAVNKCFFFSSVCTINNS